MDVTCHLLLLLLDERPLVDLYCLGQFHAIFWMSVNPAWPMLKHLPLVRVLQPEVQVCASPVYQFLQEMFPE